MEKIMTKPLALILCTPFLLGVSLVAAGAQAPATTAETHIAAARAAMAPRTASYQTWESFDDSFARMCAEPGKPASVAPTAGGLGGTRLPSSARSFWYVEPARVFDNLFYLGMNTGQATWALTDPSGEIILMDVGWDYTAQELLIDGLRKFGLDPAKVKYIVLTHGHPDHYAGVNYLLDHLAPTAGSRPRVVMSDQDWNIITKDNSPAEIKPRKDMVATDGQQLTIGNTTITLYLTPGHTPGTISVIMPLRDGDRRHVGSMWGGVILGAASGGSEGVIYFPDPSSQLKTYIASAKRFQDIGRKAGVDVLISSIERHDRTWAKIAAVKARRTGAPHPFVSSNLVSRYWDVIIRCEEAQLVWAGSGNP
jgi:metallo-beta-lactamase class B